ncbi:MAG: cell division protein FtsL [Deltaproteobacteria bacterium]|nr:cell division protein FtsL [Deltaproteobacteria bacterium]
MRVRFLALWTAAVLATAASFIAHLTLRFETIRLGYNVGDAREVQRELIESKRLLSLEAATLRQADRIETVARGALSMDEAEPIQIISVGGGSSAEPPGRIK